LNQDKLPIHVAIIMDGNGRWATTKGLPRIEGHRVGMNKIKQITDICSKRGIRILTLYAFSNQNWHRPHQEVDFLISRFERYLDREEEDLKKKKIQLRVIGRRDNLPSSLKERIKRVTFNTRNNQDFILNLAISYGGQEEIVDAVKAISFAVKKGTISFSDINKELFKRYLYTPDIPYPDLLIRTGGEFRVSNFLLWQIAYTEIWITPICWPGFNEEHFLEALRDYAGRERKFGRIREE